MFAQPPGLACPDRSPPACRMQSRPPAGSPACPSPPQLHSRHEGIIRCRQAWWAYKAWQQCRHVKLNASLPASPVLPMITMPCSSKAVTHVSLVWSDSCRARTSKAPQPPGTAAATKWGHAGHAHAHAMGLLLSGHLEVEQVAIHRLASAATALTRPANAERKGEGLLGASRKPT